MSITIVAALLFLSTVLTGHFAREGASRQAPPTPVEISAPVPVDKAAMAATNDDFE